jgi:hypothetical protein
MEIRSFYELLVKETLPGIALPLVSRLLNRRVVAIETLAPQLPPVVSKRHGDFFFRAVLHDGAVIVVHIEVCFKDKPDIAARLLDCQVALFQAYGSHPVQFVLFVEDGAEQYRSNVRLYTPLGNVCSIVLVRAHNLADIPIASLSDLETPGDLILSLFMNRAGLSDEIWQQKIAENLNKFSDKELVFLLLAADYARRKRWMRPELSEGLIRKVLETTMKVNSWNHGWIIPIVKDWAEVNPKAKPEKCE